MAAKAKSLVSALGMVHGDVEADDAAIAPADDRGLIDLQMVHQREHVRGHEVVAVGLLDARAAAVAAAVHDDHPIVLGQRRHLIAPVVGVAEAAVQQDHGSPLPNTA